MRCLGSIQKFQSVGNKHCSSGHWDMVGDVTQSYSLLLWRNLPGLPAVGSTAPLPTEGEPSWCCCATRRMLLMDIIKDAKVSLNPAASGQHGKGQSPFCSLLICSSLGEAGAQDPSQGPLPKGDMENTVSSLSPYTVLWQDLIKLSSFKHLHMPLFCAQSVSQAPSISGCDFAEL